MSDCLVVFDFDQTLIPVDSDRYVVQNLAGDRWPEFKQPLSEAARQNQWTRGMSNAMQSLHKGGVSPAQVVGKSIVLSPEISSLKYNGLISCWNLQTMGIMFDACKQSV